MSLAAPALLVYTYVHLTGPHAGDGREHLRALWRGIGDELGFDASVDGLGVPRDLPPPDVRLDAVGRGLLAARERRDEEVWQASVRVEHDVLCLALMMAPPRASNCGRTWVQLENHLDRIGAGTRSGGVLGEARLFLALTTPGTDPTSALVRVAVPNPATVGWWRTYDAIVFDGGGTAQAWEMAAPNEDRSARRLILVAPTEVESDVDRLVWTNGDGELMPLARHLLHAAKLRYQIRVFQDGHSSGRVHERLDALEDELFRVDGADRDDVLARLTSEHAAALTMRTRATRMRQGLGIIAENLLHALGPALRDSPVGGPLGDDRVLATWFTGRLDDEIAGLGAAYEHTRSVLQSGAQSALVRRDATAPPVEVSPGGRPPQVFVCYTHDSEAHKDQVLGFATLLRHNGVDAQLDRWFLGERQDWYRWALDRVPRADFVIVVASPLCRVVGDGQIPANLNLGGQSEMALLRELLHRDRETWTRKLLPVLLPGHTPEEIPLFLQGHTADHYPVTDLTAAGADDLLRALTAQPPYRPPPVGPRPVLPPLVVVEPDE